MLRFDGPSASRLPVDPVFVAYNYLRSYKDGTVIEATYVGNAPRAPLVRQIK